MRVLMVNVVAAILYAVAPLGEAQAQLIDLSGYVSESCTMTSSHLVWNLDNFAIKVKNGWSFSTHTVGTVNCAATAAKINVASAKGGLSLGAGVCGPASNTCVHYVAAARATWQSNTTITSVVYAEGNGVVGSASEPFVGGGAATVTLDLSAYRSAQTLAAGTFTDTIFVRVGSNL